MGTVSGLALRVDPLLHAREIRRFRRRIVSRPDTDPTDQRFMTCSIWTGAIADDGYGRFSVTRDGREWTVKPHRYAAALELGITIAPGAVIEHVVCDNPICTRVHTDPRIGHIWPSTQSANLARMQAKGRARRWWHRDWRELRSERAERSRQLATAVRDGWDDARVRDVLLHIDPAQTTLF